MLAVCVAAVAPAAVLGVIFACRGGLRRWVRHTGACGHVIREAASALGVTHDLAGSSRGLTRELDLLRVEQALLDAGMVLAGH